MSRAARRGAAWEADVCVRGDRPVMGFTMGAGDGEQPLADVQLWATVAGACGISSFGGFGLFEH